MWRFTFIVCITFAGCEYVDESDLVNGSVPINPPVIVIDAAINDLNFNAKEWCNISYINSTGDTVFSNLKSEAKYRGGASSAYPKHSFFFELSRSFQLEGMRNDDDWMLISSYIDKTFLRHSLSYKLFTEMGGAAPQSSYVNVIQAGTPQGLYLLCERVDAKLLGVDKADTTAFIYKDANLFRAPVDTITLVEFNETFGAEQKYPDTPNKAWLMADIQEFIHNTADSVFADPATGVFSIFDINNIIDWHLLLLVTNNGDGIAKNFYLYRENYRSQIKVCPWDYDHTFGRMGDNEPNWYNKIDVTKSTFFKRIMDLNPENYLQRLVARYDDLVAQNILTEDHILELIDEEWRLIEPHLESNFVIWPASSDFYYDNNSAEDELYLLQNWVNKHLKYVNEHINSLDAKL